MHSFFFRDAEVDRRRASSAERARTTGWWAVEEKSGGPGGSRQRCTHLALKTFELVFDLMPSTVTQLLTCIRRDHGVCVAGLDEGAGRAQSASHLARACYGAKVLTYQAQGASAAQGSELGANRET